MGFPMFRLNASENCDFLSLKNALMFSLTLPQSERRKDFVYFTSVRSSPLLQSQRLALNTENSLSRISQDSQRHLHLNTFMLISLNLSSLKFWVAEENAVLRHDTHTRAFKGCPKNSAPFVLLLWRSHRFNYLGLCKIA